MSRGLSISPSIKINMMLSHNTKGENQLSLPLLLNNNTENKSRKKKKYFQKDIQVSLILLLTIEENN